MQICHFQILVLFMYSFFPAKVSLCVCVHLVQLVCVRVSSMMASMRVHCVFVIKRGGQSSEEFVSSC